MAYIYAQPKRLYAAYTAHLESQGVIDDRGWDDLSWEEQGAWYAVYNKAQEISEETIKDQLMYGEQQ
jgi:hypothetical protein